MGWSAAPCIFTALANFQVPPTDGTEWSYLSRLFSLRFSSSPPASPSISVFPSSFVRWHTPLPLHEDRTVAVQPPLSKSRRYHYGAIFSLLLFSPTPLSFLFYFIFERCRSLSKALFSNDLRHNIPPDYDSIVRIFGPST